MRELSAPARKTDGFVGGAEECLCLVDSFLKFTLRHAVRDHPAAGLNVHHAVLDDRGAQHNAGIHCAVCGKITDRTRVNGTSLLLLEFVDDFHGAYLRCTGEGTGRETGGESIDRAEIV